MATPGFEKLLRMALDQVPGYEELPNCTFPTLPILTTAFGQQHLITTFSLSDMPPLALVANSVSSPAVSLHVLLPEGYAYWQPETGTNTYLGGVQTIDQLPADYAEIVRHCTQQLSAQSKTKYSQVEYQEYFSLLEQLARHEWLLATSTVPVQEKALAHQILRSLSQLAEPALNTFYQARGQALYAWLEQATHEKNWVEKALDVMWSTVPVWIRDAQNKEFELDTTEVIPAVLDGRQCIITAFSQVSVSLAGTEPVVYLPFGACYISYPEMEVLWHPLQPASQTALLSSLFDSNGRPYLAVKQESASNMPPDNSTASAYQQCVALILEKRWLTTRYATTVEETNAACVVQGYIARLFNSPFSAYYQQQAWQLRGWVKRVAPTD